MNNTDTQIQTLVYIIMEFLKDEEKDYGHISASCIIDNLKQDFGRGRVIIIRISIITYLHSHSKSITFLVTCHDHRRRKNMP